MNRVWPYLGAIHLLTLLVLSTHSQTVVWVGLSSLGLSAIAFGLYAWDKTAARKGSRRVPERSLHVLSVLGGWPGAALAVTILRHKSQKRSFQAALAVAVVANVVLTYAALLLIARQG